MDPAPGLRARALREDVDEGRDVVVGDPLALLHGVNCERRGADRFKVGLRRAFHLLAGGDLDAAPGLHARVVGPDGTDLRPGVTVDHGAEAR